MNYYQYTAEDFAADDYFKEWVCAPTVESETFWRNFLRDYPERYYHVEEAKRLVGGLQHLNLTPDTTKSVHHIWWRIENTINSLETPIIAHPSNRWNPRVWLVAAMVVAVLVAGWIWWSGYDEHRTVSPMATPYVAAPEWVEAVNGADKTMLIQLSDGSIVQLEKNSRLKYPTEFGKIKREVYLVGGAFFDVQKNPNRPFLVFANGLVTRVLGTSFHVKAYQKDPNVTVAVKTGRVSVYADRPHPQQDPEVAGVVLTPNQKAVFHRQEATISKLLVEVPALQLPPAEVAHLVFEAAPAKKVFEALEKAYGVEVLFDEEIIKNCTLTINLTDENLYQKLEVICKVLDASYKLIDGQIIIYSKEC
ncbi:MAG: FecR family protein [Runella zeae]